MTIASDVQQLGQDALVELFELDLEVITGISSDHYYFHPGVSASSTAIVWQTKTYQPFPIKITGFDRTVRGTNPRPQLEVSNVTGTMAALALAYDDLINAKVIRRRTYAKYLDGQPGADPTQAFPDDVYYVERKVSGNKHSYVWELAAATDLEGVVLPSRPISAYVCPWAYRGTECGYTGTNYFDANDVPVGNANQDVCSKSVNGCKLRFGSTAVLPFGGFPAVKVYKV